MGVRTTASAGTLQFIREGAAVYRDLQFDVRPEERRQCPGRRSNRDAIYQDKVAVYAVRKSALIERMSKTRPVLGSSTLELIVRIAGSVAKRADPVAENAISR
jgi:hypothetical protein